MTDACELPSTKDCVTDGARYPLLEEFHALLRRLDAAVDASQTEIQRLERIVGI